MLEGLQRQPEEDKHNIGDLNVEMPAKTKELIIAVLNDYLAEPEPEQEADPRKTLEQPAPHIKEIADFAEGALDGITENNKIPQTASQEEIVLAYKILYPKMKPEIKDWDPKDLNDEQVIQLLVKRFGNVPRHSEEDPPANGGTVGKNTPNFELDI